MGVEHDPGVRAVNVGGGDRVELGVHPVQSVTVTIVIVFISVFKNVNCSLYNRVILMIFACQWRLSTGEARSCLIRNIVFIDIRIG